MSDALVLYPRALVDIDAILQDGTQVHTKVYPDQLVVSLRQHHCASECEVTVKSSALPFDPRFVNGVFVVAYMGNLPTIAPVAPTDQYIQQLKYQIFSGYADTLDSCNSSRGPLVSIRARDLSSLFRGEKNLTPKKVKETGEIRDPVPKYTDSLESAVAKIMKWVGVPNPGAMRIDDRTKDQRSKIPMDKLVSGRGKNGHIPMKNGLSAWEVIEEVASRTGCLVSVENELIVVREPISVYGFKEAEKTGVVYSFVFGSPNQDNSANSVMSIQLKKKFLINRKGIRLVSFNPGKKKRIIADYPVDADLPPKKRAPLKQVDKSGPSSSAKKTTNVEEPDREVFFVGDLGCHTEDELLKMAQRIYEERSRQELEGEIETAIWDENLFKLKNGSRIAVEIAPGLESELRNISDTDTKIQFLEHRLGINQEAATALLNISRNKQSDIFIVRSIHHDWSPKGAKTKVDFVNIREVDLDKGA